MIRFAVHDNLGLVGEDPVANAYMFGPDDIPVRGEVSFKSGVIRCKRNGEDPAGLCLQFDAGSAGVLMLPTCLLPVRKEPYRLVTELARHRIKMFIAKSEEWQMFDLSAEHPAMKEWEAARQLLTEAWTTSDPAKSDHAAMKALIKGIDATERLAMAHAEILLYRRYSQRAASSSTLGVRVWPGRNSQPLRDLIKKDFDLIVLPLNWKELEVSEGKYEWGKFDSWFDWARKEGKPVVAGPLLDFSEAAVPEWIKVWQHDYDTCRDLVYDHIEMVVARYKSAVGMWNIASGLNINDHFSFTIEQMLDLTRMTALHVRHERKGARVMVELRQPFGGHYALNRDSVYPFTFIERITQEGIRLDAIGVQLLLGEASTGGTARDTMQISSLLDRFFIYEKPILVSALGVPSDATEGALGRWRNAWSQEQQAKWVSRLFPICLSKPFIDSVFWADLFDYPHSAVPFSGLISDTGKAKAALSRLITFRRHLRKPMGAMRDSNALGKAADENE